MTLNTIFFNLNHNCLIESNQICYHNQKNQKRKTLEFPEIESFFSDNKSRNALVLHECETWLSCKFMAFLILLE